MSAIPQRVVALYCRISEDKRGKKEGVEAQERRGRAFAEIEWPGHPVEVFADPDITATDPDIIRPEFERLREWIRAGRVAYVWSIEWFRLVRMPPQWFELAAELEAAGIEEIYTHRDGIVRVDDDVSDIKAVLGGREVKRTKRRVNDYNEDMAKRGLPPGSQPFGYRRTKIKGVQTYEQIPEQAAALRWAAEQILESNWSIERCARALRERGVKGPHRRKVIDETTGEPVIDVDTGEPVTRETQLHSSVLRKALMSPSAAGLRVHKGVVIGRGNWYDRRILTEQQRQRILARFGAGRTVRTTNGFTYPVPAPVGAGSGRTRRRYLFTGGIAVCGICDVQLIASEKQMGRPGRKRSVPYYFCHPKHGGRSCVGIMADATEQYVIDTMMAELAKPGRIDAYFSDEFAERRSEIVGELADIETRRSELATMWGARQLSSDEWRIMRAGLDEEEHGLRSELASVPPPPEGMDPRVLLDPRVWGGLTLDEQRGWIERFIKRVTINRATPPYSTIDFAARVTIDWK